VPVPPSFDYATVRIVPRVEREEFINIGVVVFSAERRFLDCRIELPEAKLRALAPDADLTAILRHVEAFRGVCTGDKGCGPIARLPASERFHWLVAPRSAVIQTSRVHSGLGEKPEEAVERLFDQLVRLPSM
jgi:hypothetical protein